MSGFQFIHYEKYKKDDIAGIIGKHRAPRLLPSRRKCAGSDDSEGNLEELQVRLQHDVAHYKKLSKDGKLKKIRDDANISCSPGFFLSGCDSKTR